MPRRVALLAIAVGRGVAAGVLLGAVALDLLALYLLIVWSNIQSAHFSIAEGALLVGVALVAIGAFLAATAVTILFDRPPGVGRVGHWTTTSIGFMVASVVVAVLRRVGTSGPPGSLLPVVAVLTAIGMAVKSARIKRSTLRAP